MMRRLLLVLAAVATLTSFAALAQLGGASGVVIPYRGKLERNGAPVEASVNFRFTLWDAATGGTACATTYEESTAVRGGVFSVEIGPIDETCVLGKPVFLAVEVDGGTGYTQLDGRQRVFPALAAMTSGPGDFFVQGLLNVLGDTFLNRARVTSTEEVATGSGGALIIGNPQGLNVGVDENEVSARNNGAGSTLRLNEHGGLVLIGDGVQVTGDSDLRGAVNVGGNLTVTGTLTKASGPGLSCTDRSSGYSGNSDDATVSVYCAADEMLTGCSCFSPWGNCDGSFRGSTNPRQCTAQNGTGGDRVMARAICCKLQ